MPDILDQLAYKSGQEPFHEDTVIIPLLTLKGITHAISMGPASQNMAESFNFSGVGLSAIQKEFLQKNSLSDFSTAYISHVPRPEEDKLIDITKPNKSGASLAVPAEGMFTTLPGVPLIHKPADCPTAIIYGKSSTGNAVLGLIHLGRPQVNNRTTETALEHLEKKYDVDLTTITVGISPSISPSHYFIKEQDQVAKNILDLSYWDGYVKRNEINHQPVLQVNVLGKILSVLSEFGVPEQNIQAYGHSPEVDTYTLAAKNPPLAFSHRYAISTNQPEKNGRIMVACEL